VAQSHGGLTNKISSSEAELLALSQTAKEAIFISRLFKAMTLKLNEPLYIDRDNTQTLRLIKEDTAKLINTPTALATSGIRHETSIVSIETDGGDGRY
jgi:hypothetical protein